MKLPSTVPEVATPTPECPNPSLWKCYDGMATEVEVLEFLGALVKMIKPQKVIETGTYLGYGTYHLAKALMDSNHARYVIETAEPDAQRAQEAVRFFKTMGVDQEIIVRPMRGEQMIESIKQPIDFAFLDSNLDTRIREMYVLAPKLSKQGVIAVHDTNTYHAQNNGPRVPFLQYAIMYGYQAINFDTPRGLMLLRKRP